MFKKKSKQKPEPTSVGTHNESTRVSWLEQTLKKIPAGYRILDAGAGEQQFKKFCSHLNYVSQDFGEYEPANLDSGLQMEKWDYSGLDIICDVVAIPEPDASFDAIMCTEVFEHIPEPVLAVKEFSRLIRKEGFLIITAPFCSLTHFAPYHYSTGFNKFFYEKVLFDYGFEIIELSHNGNYFEYLAQELNRTRYVAQKYVNDDITPAESEALNQLLTALQRFSTHDKASQELLCFGIHVLAKKK